MLIWLPEALEQAHSQAAATTDDRIDDPMDVDELSEGEAVAPVQGALVGNKQGKLSTSSCVCTVNVALAESTAVGTKGKKVKKAKKATTGTVSKAKSPYRYVYYSSIVW